MRAAAALVVVGVTAAAATAIELPAPDDAKVIATVELLADREVLVAGETATLALRFDIQPEWHIYWRNAGVAGFAPMVKWKLPPGYAVGPLQFPPPHRYTTPNLGDSYILDARPVLLATLTVPADAPVGGEVEITGKAEWLVCRTECVRETQPVAIKLPVVARGTAVKAAHADVFEPARQRLPVAASAAKYTHVTIKATQDRIRPSDEMDLAAIIEIRDGYSLRPHVGVEAGQIATDLFPEPARGVEFSEARFPAPQRQTIAGAEGAKGYAGRLIARLPIKAYKDLKGDRLALAGVVTYEAVDNATGTAYPEAVDWSIDVPIGAEGSKVAAIDVGADDAGGTWLSRVVRPQSVSEQHSWWFWMVLAVVAGLILNVTPCVLPVISIKVLSFVQQAKESPARVFKLGLAFALGMMIVFNLLAVLAVGAGQVWGQQFQNPTFVLAMTAVIFAFGLSLFGVFTLGVPRTIEDLASRQEREGYLGSMAKGALATVLGTPCLGPLLGPVLAWTSTQGSIVAIVTFNMIGVGMALPYVVLTAKPAWLRYVPKPGVWMETFKHVMGFALMGTVVYLLWILAGLEGAGRLIGSLAVLLGVALACWLWGRYVTLEISAARRMIVRAVALVIVAATWGATVYVSRENPRPAMTWQEFSLQRVEELTTAGHTVMVDVTADWCPNCQVNSKLVLNTDDVARAVNELGVVPLLADWTKPDDDIGQLVAALAPRASIPLLAIFPAGRPHEPIVLLGLVTKDQVIESLKQAGPSRADAPAIAAQTP